MDSALREMFNRAAYLHERSVDRTSVDQSAVKEEIEKWEDIVSSAFFADRLKQDHMTKEKLESLVSEKDAPSLKKELPWLVKLEHMLSIYEPGEIDVTSFQAIIDPFIYYAKKTLQKHMDPIPEDIIRKQSVIASIAEALYLKLHKFILKSVILEVNIARKIGMLEGETSSERFQYFMRQFMEKESLRMEFFSNYPVLARLLVEGTLNSIQMTTEIISRFTDDRESIKTLINGRVHPLKQLKIGIGDTHQNGRAVSILLFEDGNSVVYKPRSLAVDECFQSVISWINQTGKVRHPLAVAKVINQGTYGWQEFIPYKECNKEEEVSHFYYRQGAYTALFYVLGSSDFHAENIIASGEYPIPVDLETLFSKNLEMSNHVKEQNQLTAELNNSVYASLMLPTPVFENSFIDFDLSAIGAGGNQQSKKVKSRKVVNEGTDEMRLSKEYATLGTYQNRPSYNGKVYDTEKYEGDIQAGFRDMYMLFLYHKQAFLQEDGPLSTFKHAPIRQVFRPTHVYAEFLQNSLHPDYLFNGLSRVQLFDYLWQITSMTDQFEQLVRLETKDLLRHDVPYFYFIFDSTSIYDSDGNCIEHFFDETGLETVRRRIQSLNIHDYKKQSQYLRWSLASMRKDVWRADGVKQEPSEKLSLSWMDEAIRLGEILSDRAIVETDGNEVNWIGLHLNEDNGVSVGVKSIDLYDGLLGYALFFAHLAKETNIEKYEERSRMTMATVMQKAGEKPSNQSISAFSGEGSYLYGLVHLGLLWKDSSLIDRASQRVDGLYDLVDQEETLDFVGGLAGFIVACLHIFESTKRGEFLQIAEYAGEALYRNMQHIPLHGATLLTGLSHGAAGIAWAFARLGTALNKDPYLEQAEKLIHYENSHFQPNTNNWKDLRTNKAENGNYFWCHGAPGIVLSRLHAVGLEEGTIAKNLRVALQTTTEHGMTDSHSLCHGSLGNIDILLHAAKVLQNDQLYETALEMGEEVLQQQKQAGWEFGLGPGIEMDGFMLGRAGIGYALLRLWNTNIPSVLALELPGEERI